MDIQIIPAPNSETLWRLIVDGECYEEGNYEEMDEAAQRMRAVEEPYYGWDNYLYE